MASVFYSDALRAADISLPVHAEGYEENQFIYRSARIAMEEKGIPPSSEQVPLKYYCPYHDMVIDAFAEGLHKVDGYLAVTPSCRAVLERHDLGQGDFIKIDLLQHDRKIPVLGELFILALGAAKAALVPEASARIKPNDFNPSKWALPLDPAPGEIAVSENALEGVDLWIDPAAQFNLFASGHLVRALIEAGFDKSFHFTECAIVTE